jgi:hypothetical protein
MKISIANKKLLSKPQSNIEKAKYFKDITFKSGNISKDTFLKVIETGCTITYLYKDSEFNRNNSYMKNHYLGTQFICVDIDSCDINPIEFVEGLKYKPTLLHTTFGNLTPQKQNKWHISPSVAFGYDPINKQWGGVIGIGVNYDI